MLHLFMQEEKRFHEDIFGISYRAPKIFNTEVVASGPILPKSISDKVRKGTKTFGWRKLPDWTFFGCFRTHKWELPHLNLIN